jgi:effector-binding domain-containing protein
VDLFNGLQQAGVSISGPCMTIYHAGEPEIDAEVCAPLAPEAKNVHGVTVHTLPEVETMASTIHQGSFAGLAGAYAELLKWIDTNGYSLAGPDRAIYLRLPEEGKSRQDPNAITEMQVPVCKD